MSLQHDRRPATLGPLNQKTLVGFWKRNMEAPRSRSGTRQPKRRICLSVMVKLRYFVGLKIPEAAEVLGISEATAKRWWAYARAWLFHEIQPPRG
jgi:hypothetical protein